jgi:thiamine-monophosphate kinase
MRAKPRSRTTALPSEDDLLARIRRALTRSSANSSALRLAIGDDAAIFRPRHGYETLLTCDWFLQGPHFLLDRHPAYSIGWKCLARAVSDLAAMGAEPRCFLLSIALPATHTGNWLNEFLRGLRSASHRLNCPAAGGDTTRQDRVLINITIVGECRRGQAVLRSGAGPGDAIFVSGRLGEAELGLRLIRNRKSRIDARDSRLSKHLFPQPHLALGTWLAEQRLATSMMDLSDGLSSDLLRLCAASGVGARIEAQRIPRPQLSSAQTKKYDALELALHGGDDYELLFTVAPENISRIPRRIAGTSLTRIGRIVSEKTILTSTDGRQEISLPQKGWDPFSK